MQERNAVPECAVLAVPGHPFVTVEPFELEQVCSDKF